MAGSFNSMTLVGFLGRDPDSKYVASGEMLTTFSVATTERRKDGSETTTWFRVSTWGKLAEVAGKHLHSGSYVYVEGPLSQREYTGNDGQVRQSLEVRARELRMLDRRTEDAEPATVGAAPVAAGSAQDADVPF